MGLQQETGTPGKPLEAQLQVEGARGAPSRCENIQGTLLPAICPLAPVRGLHGNSGGRRKSGRRDGRKADLVASRLGSTPERGNRGPMALSQPARLLLTGVGPLSSRAMSQSLASENHTRGKRQRKMECRSVLRTFSQKPHTGPTELRIQTGLDTITRTHEEDSRNEGSKSHSLDCPRHPSCGFGSRLSAQD